ncbi:beta-ketoacyl-[acyl-carrier-protein] synthase family protein [Jidongwangia harbinensis]|uniref:beta-ketoacyl-[acyl-carrier-protein] synthase family protein n=1 Tax=Jidongwangia harbinensis TaxID=2878561 RepID=UPI001CDA3DFB|nr:beta-ketoacyl-[acyl-carrier-protein] synthase family protein [Jidongwangia harbinensis]MCA2215101.1 beta-ketoacyl-[acyl-carrier-protein] synthase family protein [Jidongwangia harbinensis]
MVMGNDRDVPRRVVVTGIGVVSSIGIGVDDFLAGLRSGRSGAGPITSFDTTGFEYANACEVRGFDPAAAIEASDPARLGRTGQFATSAARMALRDSSMGIDELRSRRSVVSVGTTNGEGSDFDDLTAQQLSRGPAGLDEQVAARVNAGRLSAGVAAEFGLTDVEAISIPTACAAGNYAIGYGFDALRAGDAEVAICGGADSLDRKTFAGFYRLGTIAPEVCQPFDLDRKGILTGEGAAMLCMESLDSALARGAHIYAEVLGFGLSCDAHHAVAPEADGLVRCMRLAHEDAGLKPDQVDFISAHGTGTRANDVTEAAAIRRLFGDRPPPTISIKSMVGHSMGAASAVAAAACALAIDREFIPPTIHHRQTDPEVGLDCVPNVARPARPRVVQNNALAFGGNNAVLLLGHYPGTH